MNEEQLEEVSSFPVEGVSGEEMKASVSLLLPVGPMVRLKLIWKTNNISTATKI